MNRLFNPKHVICLLKLTGISHNYINLFNVIYLSKRHSAHPPRQFTPQKAKTIHPLRQFTP